VSIPIEQLIVTLIEQELGVSQQQQSSAQALAQFNTLLSAINANLTLTRTVLQQVLALQGQLQQVDADLANLISLCQQTGRPVTLPSTPPPGYGGASGPSIANDVWNHMEPGSSRTVGYWQELMGALALNFGQTIRLPVYDNGLMALVYDYSNEFEPTPPSTSPDFDLTTILPTDANVADWLNRIDTQGNLWALNPNGFATSSNLITGYGYWICEIDPLMFARFKAQLAGTATYLPPVWPGIANVTLGASQALADGLLIPGPLAGVIIVISAVPQPISYYPFGPIKSYVHVGGIAFVDDNGQVETVQPIGLDANVVCPKAMVLADHAYIRLQSGVTGTVRPWTKT
jgi:hypothetical protein